MGVAYLAAAIKRCGQPHLRSELHIQGSFRLALV